MYICSVATWYLLKRDFVNRHMANGAEGRYRDGPHKYRDEHIHTFFVLIYLAHTIARMHVFWSNVKEIRKYYVGLRTFSLINVISAFELIIKGVLLIIKWLSYCHAKRTER